MKNQRGQAATEMVIMLVIMLGIISIVSTALRNNNYFAELVTTPWRQTAGLIQNGVWGSPKQTMIKHPSHIDRVNTVRGDEVKKL